MILTNHPWMIRDNRVFLLAGLNTAATMGTQKPYHSEPEHACMSPITPSKGTWRNSHMCALAHTSSPASEALLFWESHVRQKSIVFLHSIALVGLFGPRRNLISSRLECTELQYICIVPTLLASCWQGTCCPKSAGIELKIDIEKAAVHSFRLCHVLTALIYHLHVSMLFL